MACSFYRNKYWNQNLANQSISYAFCYKINLETVESKRKAKPSQVTHPDFVIEFPEPRILLLTYQPSELINTALGSVGTELLYWSCVLNDLNCHYQKGCFCLLSRNLIENILVRTEKYVLKN